jgi:pimeloyl-ACP methyl ester carboxylesterase
MLFKVSFTIFEKSLSDCLHKALGWNKENFSIIGHSYGAMLGTIVSIFYTKHQ